MSQEKGRQYDGRSRPTNDTYRKRWDEIFKKVERNLWFKKRRTRTR